MIEALGNKPVDEEGVKIIIYLAIFLGLPSIYLSGRLLGLLVDGFNKKQLKKLDQQIKKK